jgi:undecaprenyl diphosphate synthase
MDHGIQALPPTIPMGLHGVLRAAPHRPGTPRHLALVLQGHRHWALSSNLPYVDVVGAAAGRLLELIDFCATRELDKVTVHLFSDDLCRLPPGSNSEIVRTFMRYITAGAHNLHRNDVSLSIEGPLNGLDSLTRALLQDVAKRTRLNTGLQLTVAIDSPRFGGQKPGSGSHKPSFFDPSEEPDFVVRTGGPLPVHRAMLWDTQRTALYFTDALWPNFDARRLGAALTWFGDRHRGVGIQLSAPDSPTLRQKLS